MRHYLLLAVLMILTVLTAATTGIAHDLILRSSDRSEVSFVDMMRDLQRVPVVFVGESHTIAAHLDLQLRIIGELRRAGKNLAIGLEIFTADDQGELDRWVAGKIDEPAFMKIYQRNWTYPWPSYRPLFVYAREHGIPLLGLNIDRSITSKVVREGFQSLTPQERKKLPFEITCTVDAEYRKLIRRSFAHHEPSGKTFENFCEAQLLWNRSMAYHLAGYLEKNPGKSIVVLTGTGHAIKGGIPVELGLRLPSVAARIVLPDPVVQDGPIMTDDTDYLWLSH